jgi:hypothetical protein
MRVVRKVNIDIDFPVDQLLKHVDISGVKRNFPLFVNIAIVITTD